jgi:hypothetical protein
MNSFSKNNPRQPEKFYTMNDWNRNQDATYRPPPEPHRCTSSMGDTTGPTAATKSSMNQYLESSLCTTHTLLVTVVYHATVRKGHAMETVRGRHGGGQRENG